MLAHRVVNPVAEADAMVRRRAAKPLSLPLPETEGVPVGVAEPRAACGG